MAADLSLSVTASFRDAVLNGREYELVDLSWAMCVSEEQIPAGSPPL
jgi:hypothetical protein